MRVCIHTYIYIYISSKGGPTSRFSSALYALPGSQPAASQSEPKAPSGIFSGSLGFMGFGFGGLGFLGLGFFGVWDLKFGGLGFRAWG